MQSVTPILATGKVAKAADINQRVQQLNGLTLEQALKQVRLPSNKPPGYRLYNISDYKYDLKSGYIQHAALAQAATQTELSNAWNETGVRHLRLSAWLDDTCA